MKSIRMCKICSKPTGKKPQGKYCVKCDEVFQRRGAKRYKLCDGVHVWVKGRIMRVMVQGKDTEPIYELTEVVE